MFSKISHGEETSHTNLITSNRIYLSTQSGYRKHKQCQRWWLEIAEGFKWNSSIGAMSGDSEMVNLVIPKQQFQHYSMSIHMVRDVPWLLLLSLQKVKMKGKFFFFKKGKPLWQCCKLAFHIQRKEQTCTSKDENKKATRVLRISLA